jgi:hypothetical protein
MNENPCRVGDTSKDDEPQDKNMRKYIINADGFLSPDWATTIGHVRILYTTHRVLHMYVQL